MSKGTHTQLYTDIGYAIAYFFIRKANWSSHKAICKAFKSLEAKHGADVIIPFIVAEPDLGTDEEQLNKTINMVAQIEMNALHRELRRELTVIERNMIGWQPRCLAWCAY